MKESKNIIIAVITLVLGFMLYNFFFSKPTRQAYCQSQTDFKQYKFRQAVKKNGADQKVEENEQIKKFLTDKYHACLK